MDIMGAFWIFLMLVAIQPVIRQKLLEASRQRMLARLERERRSRVILLVHRQETMSFLGFPFFRYIDIHDSEEVLRAIHMTDKNVPIDLVLHTPGGLVLAALQIARALRGHPAKVTCFVPHYAMSGGTLIALAADEIVMSPHAVLGPVDPQLGQNPAPSILKVVQQKPIAEIDDQTLILADQAQKAINQLRKSLIEIIGDRMPPDQAEKLADLLSSGTWTHDHPLTVQDVRELGLPVNDQMPETVYRLLTLYPQPTRHQPSVEYLPFPRHADRGNRP